MAISTPHKLDKIKCTTPALDLSAIKSAKMGVDPQIVTEFAGGHTDPQFCFVASEKPMCEATTPDLHTFFTAVPLGGAALATGVMYLKAATSTGSTARASLAHKTLSIPQGIIYPTRLSLQHSQVSTVDFVMVSAFDGVNAPVVYAGSAALSGNLTLAYFFGAGPLALNGVAVPGIQSVEVDMGISVMYEGGESELYFTFVGIEKREPTLTINTKTPVNFNTYGLAGTALNGTTGVTFYARKFTQGTGTRVADVTAEHVKFVGALGTVVPQDTAGEGTGLITDSLKCQLVAGSDSVVPIVATPSSAIT